MSNFRALLILGTVFVGHVAPAGAAELLMFERPGCPACAAWNKEVGAAYHLTKEGQKAPLRRIHIAEYKNINVIFLDKIAYTPTFVLVASGREVGRIVGYSNDDAFWGLFGELLKRPGLVDVGRH